MQKLKDWFAALKPRERIMVSAGAVLVVLVALFMGVAPFYKSVQLRAERVQRKEGDLAWMRSVAPELQALGQNQPVAGPVDESLVVLVDRTARECGLSSALNGQTPNGDTGVRVRLESAAFDVLVKCLGTLQQAHAVTIEAATFDRTAKAGVVNANLLLNRAPT
jgi:type II secretory pathway component PulM